MLFLITLETIENQVQYKFGNHLLPSDAGFLKQIVD